MHVVRARHLFVALLGFTWTASASPQVALIAAAEARNSPGGSVVASLLPGARVTRGSAAGSEIRVVIEGWVDESRLAGKTDTFPASVGGRQALRIRATPSTQGSILGELRPGAGVVTLGKKGTWMHVRRAAWIAASSLNAEDAQSAALQNPASSQPGPPGSLSATRTSKLLSSPSGAAVGEVASGAIVQALARDHDWVRVRLEGWVRQRDLAPADSTFAAGLSAADIRADPEGTRGRVVRWEVQLLSLQQADPLRHDMARDEPYLLAKGPGSENALLYLAVPPSLLAEARTFPPLTVVIITARIRTGRSEPVGTPILDLKTITRR